VIADATPYPSKGRSETLKKTLLNTASKTLDLIESFRKATCPACHGYATEHLNKSGSFGRAIVRVLPATAKSHPAEATAPVDQPSPIFDDDADRRLLANFCLKEAKQPSKKRSSRGSRAIPPRNTNGRCACMWSSPCCGSCWLQPIAGDVSTRPPAGWQRGRRPLLERTREKVIVFAKGGWGIFYLAESSLLLGVKLKDRLPRIQQEILAKDRRLVGPRCVCRNLSHRVAVCLDVISSTRTKLSHRHAPGDRSPRPHPGTTIGKYLPVRDLRNQTEGHRSFEAQRLPELLVTTI
jgi:hypothetical protein